MSLLSNPLAVLSDTYKHDPTRYSHEKVIGRRTEKGTLELKRLRPVHRVMIALHVKGFSVGEIAFITGYSEPSVYRVIDSTIARAYIELHCNSVVDDEIAALMPLSVDAVRDALRSEDKKLRLLAADRVFKLTGRYDQGRDQGETAEDVIARALEVMKTQAETVRDVTAERNMRVISGGASHSVTNEVTKLEKKDGISNPSNLETSTGSVPVLLGNPDRE